MSDQNLSFEAENGVVGAGNGLVWWLGIRNNEDTKLS